MRRTIFLVAFIAQCLLFSANAANIYSPNGKISASLEGKTLKLNYNNKHVIDILVDVTGSKDTDFSLVSKITADYQMLSGKRLHCKNEANEYRLENLVLRLYNDGVAFRYEYDLKEKIIADKYKLLFKQALKRLENVAESMPILSEELTGHNNIRKLNVRKYILFYIVDDKNNKVFVVRIGHALMDWENLLN